LFSFFEHFSDWCSNPRIFPPNILNLFLNSEKKKLYGTKIYPLLFLNLIYPKEMEQYFLDFCKLHIISVPGERIAYVEAITRSGDKSSNFSRNKCTGI
jgi:hypothetical protein